MIKVLRDWMQRYFSDEEAVVLAIMLVLGFSVILAFGGMLAPVLAAMVIAFLIQGVVGMLERFRVPHLFAVWLVYSLFLGLLALFLVVLLPLLWQQLFTLFNELPRMLGEWQSVLLMLPERYPSLISEEQVLKAIETARGEFGQIGQWALTSSLASLPVVVNVMIYLVLVPILVFFFLKDKKRFHTWFHRYLPRERGLMKQVWAEMNQQIANYIRGKVIEIVITGAVTYIAFAYLGAQLRSAAGPAGRPVGGGAVHRRGGGERTGGDDRLLPVGLERPVHLPDGGPRDHPGAGWQRAGAAAVLRGGEPAPGGDHLRGVAVRRALGLLGRVLRDPPGDPGESGAGCLAQGPSRDSGSHAIASAA